MDTIDINKNKKFRGERIKSCGFCVCDLKTYIVTNENVIIVGKDVVGG